MKCRFCIVVAILRLMRDVLKTSRIKLSEAVFLPHILLVLLAVAAVIIFMKPIESKTIQWSSVEQIERRLPAGDEFSFVFRDTELDVELDYSSPSSGDIYINRHKDATSFESSEELSVDRLMLRFKDVAVGGVQKVTLNDASFECFTQKIRSSVHECSVNPDNSLTETSFRITKVVSSLGLLFVVITSFSIWRWFKRPYLSIHKSKQYDFKLHPWLLAPLAVIVGLTLWLPPYDNALFFVTNSPYQPSSFGALWSFNGFVFSSVIDFIRGLSSLIFGSALESRLYFSAVMLVVYFASGYASLILSRRWAKLSSIQLQLLFAVVGMAALLNPFTVQRLILGHHLLLIGMSFFVLLLALMLSLPRPVTQLSLINSSALALVCIAVSPHFLPLVFVVMIIYLFTIFPSLEFSKTTHSLEKIKSLLAENKVK